MKVGINLTKYVIQELNQVGLCELENVYHSKFKNLYEIYSTLKHILNSEYMLKFSSKPLSIAKNRYNGNLQTQFNVVFLLFHFVSFFIFSSPVQSTGRAIVVTLSSALALALALPLVLPLAFPSRHF